MNTLLELGPELDYIPYRPLSGSCLIIIGPENNDGGRHCEPEPLYLQTEQSKDWIIEAKFR